MHQTDQQMVNTFKMLQKISIKNKWKCKKLFIEQQNKYFWRSCDTEDWSNDTQYSAAEIN